MNTAKKRILSLTLTICLALSMMLTLSACGKKNLEEYFNTDTMQKLVHHLEDYRKGHAFVDDAKSEDIDVSIAPDLPAPAQTQRPSPGPDR